MGSEDLVARLDAFDIPKKAYRAVPVRSGYIHKSFIILVDDTPLYVLQQFNTQVFKDPGSVYENFKTISPFLHSPDYSHYPWILTKNGSAFYHEKGDAWRLIGYVGQSTTLEKISTDSQAFACGYVLGMFHQLLADVSVKGLKVPMPNFHDLSFRWQELELAMQEGIPERLKKIQPIWDEITDLHRYLSIRPDPKRMRICHNDTKLSNILFHKVTYEALCLVDLDTVMPGYFHYDFGDMARTILGTRTEDDPTRTSTEINFMNLDAMLKGIKASGLVLEKEELEALPYGLALMPFLHSIRALGDYLQGDRYYRVTHPEQNWHRAIQLLTFAKKAQEKTPEIRGRINSIHATTI